jgi:ubiquinol-cytochrome c reductase cytochrome c1 subunit
LVLVKPGEMSPAEYDGMVADLVNYLAFMAEPAKAKRLQLGIIVLLALAVFFMLALALKKEFWKDVH